MNNLKKTYLLFILLFISITGLFFSAWNSYINNSGHLFLPAAFLSLSYILLTIIIIRYQALLPESNIKQNQIAGNERKSSSHREEFNPVDFVNLSTRLIGRKKTTHPDKSAHNVLRNFSSEFSIMQGIFYSYNPENKFYSMIASYAYAGKDEPTPFKLGEGIHGQAILDRKLMEVANLPDDYSVVTSGLGNTHGRFLYLIPFLLGNETPALVEFTVLKPVGEKYIYALGKILGELGEKWMELNKDEN